jgi:putative transposase
MGRPYGLVCCLADWRVCDPKASQLLYTVFMRYDPNKHHRRSIRLEGYDYSQPGAYFITLTTLQRARLFGEIIDGELRLNAAGRVVEEELKHLAARFGQIRLGEYIIMPNHLHAILMIADSGIQERLSLGVLIGQFKSRVTKRLRATNPVWQRNYYEHIIRNQEDMDRIREYIRENPRRWDEEHDHDL